MLRTANSTLKLSNNVRKIRRKILNCNYICNVLYGQSRSFCEEFEYRVSTSVIRESLLRAKAEFKDGHACFNLRCTFCSSGRSDSKLQDKNLFINKKTGNFLCQECKTVGSWAALSRILNIPNDKSVSDQFDFNIDCSNYDASQKWETVSKHTDRLCDIDDESFDMIMKRFDFSDISKTVISKLDVRIGNEGNVIYFPLMCEEVVVGYLSVTADGMCATYPKVDCPGYVSCNDVKGLSEVVVVADIRDFMALSSVGLQGVVCLPYGLRTLPQNVLPFFESCDKIILWLGNSFGSLNASIQFAKKLIEKRCHLIRPTEGQESATKALKSGKDLRKIVSEAKPIWHQFVTTFETLREDVVAEIRNITEVTGVQWSRFPVLNKILKGHRRGELTVLTGGTGCGKTTFLSEYSLDLAMNGVNTLWGSFEIKNSRLARTMLQQFSGTAFTEENLDAFHEWADKFENLPIYFLTFHGQHSIKTVMGAVEHCSYVYDIGHVVIDNIQFMIDVANEAKYVGRFWTQDCILQSFRSFATDHNCHVTLVIHPRKELEGNTLSINSVFGTAKATQEADNILIIQDRPSVHLKCKKYLQVNTIHL